MRRSPRVRAQRGQAIVETALLLGLLYSIAAGGIAVLAIVDGYITVDAAVDNACNSVFAAPLGDATRARQYASTSYQRSIDSRLLRADAVTVESADPSGNVEAGYLEGVPRPGGAVHCSARATVLTSHIPLIPFDISLSATATALQPPLRSCGPGSGEGACS